MLRRPYVFLLLMSLFLILIAQQTYAPEFLGSAVMTKEKFVKNTTVIVNETKHVEVPCNPYNVTIVTSVDNSVFAYFNATFTIVSVSSKDVIVSEVLYKDTPFVVDGKTITVDSQYKLGFPEGVSMKKEVLVPVNVTEFWNTCKKDNGTVLVNKTVLLKTYEWESIKTDETTEFVIDENVEYCYDMGDSILCSHLYHCDGLVAKKFGLKPNPNAGCKYRIISKQASSKLNWTEHGDMFFRLKEIQTKDEACKDGLLPVEVCK